MGGNLYMMDATRVLTTAAIDLGEKPAVLSAIAKLHLTERGAQVVNDAMDVVGGKGICMGPSNFLGAAYMQLPVAITVEGANILTRSLIVFGQGAIRCHPYVLKEIEATRETDPGSASAAFDAALFGHLAIRAVEHGAHARHWAHRLAFRHACPRTSRRKRGAITSSSRGSRRRSRSWRTYRWDRSAAR